MNASELLRWQWEGYPRYHRSRFNLLLHIVLVPLFLLSTLAFLRAILQHTWLAALLALGGMLLSIALQGRGHRHEPVPPEPFAGPGDAISRIFLEQWITFPRFVLSGGWLRALRDSNRLG